MKFIFFTIHLNNCTAIEVTHCPQLCQAQGVAVFSAQKWMSADIFPEFDNFHLIYFNKHLHNASTFYVLHHDGSIQAYHSVNLGDKINLT